MDSIVRSEREEGIVLVALVLDHGMMTMKMQLELEPPVSEMKIGIEVHPVDTFHSHYY